MKKPEGASNKSFGLTMATAFFVFGVIGIYKNSKLPFVFIPFAFLFLLASLFAPNLLTRPNRLWTKLGLLLHTITSPIILFVLFYGIFTPFGLIMRAFGKKFFPLRADASIDTYWIPKKPLELGPASLKLPY